MNESLNLKDHIFLKCNNDIGQICNPLKDFLGIENFSLRRIYADGSHFYLCTNGPWVEHYFNMNYWKMGKFHRVVNDHRLTHVLWNHWPKEDLLFLSLLKDSSDNFNQTNGLSLIREYEDYIDVYSFASTRDNENINNLYLSNIAPLEKFVDYFLSVASKIIQKAEKEKIYFPKEGMSTFSDRSCILKSTNFNESLYPKVVLSKREMECVRSLVDGKTAKETAREFDLSPRTVETYLNNIRHKMQCKNRLELVKKVIEQNLINALLIKQKIDL